MRVRSAFQVCKFLIWEESMVWSLLRLAVCFLSTFSSSFYPTFCHANSSTVTPRVQTRMKTLISMLDKRKQRMWAQTLLHYTAITIRIASFVNPSRAQIFGEHLYQSSHGHRRCNMKMIPYGRYRAQSKSLEGCTKEDRLVSSLQNLRLGELRLL